MPTGAFNICCPRDCVYSMQTQCMQYFGMPFTLNCSDYGPPILKRKSSPWFFIFGFYTGSLLSGGFCPAAFCRGAFRWGAFDLEPLLKGVPAWRHGCAMPRTHCLTMQADMDSCFTPNWIFFKFRLKYLSS